MDTSWPPSAGSRNSNTVIRGLSKYGPGQMTYSPNDNGRAGTGADYHTYGMAVDFYAPNGSTQWHERMRDFAKWLYDHYAGSLLELIHTTPFNTDNGFYVKRGQKVGVGFYGAAVEQAHVDHVHVAMDTPTAKSLLAKLAGSTPATPVSTPTTGRMYGLDLADPYQAGINLSVVKSAGFDFVNIKTSQGLGYVNPRLGQWVSEAKSRGMGISVFHWLDRSGSGAAQAAKVLGLLRSNGILDTAAVQCDNEDNADWATTRDFTNAMQDGLGRHIAMYTGDWWAAGHGPSWNVASLTPYLWAPPNAGYLTSYPGDTSSHWVANYWGYSNLSLMQYAVNPIANSGVGNVSKSCIRDPDVWAALTGEDMAITDADAAKIAKAVWRNDGNLDRPTVLPDDPANPNPQVTPNWLFGDQYNRSVATEAAVKALAQVVAGPVGGLTAQQVLDQVDKTLKQVLREGATS